MKSVPELLISFGVAVIVAALISVVAWGILRSISKNHAQKFLGIIICLAISQITRTFISPNEEYIITTRIITYAITTALIFIAYIAGSALPLKNHAPQPNQPLV